MESTTRNKILSYVPTVIEASSRGERSFDIFSRLLRERIIFLGDEIDDELANSIVAQMLLLDSENPEKDIMLYINSPGGVITARVRIMSARRPDRSKAICVRARRPASKCWATRFICSARAPKTPARIIPTFRRPYCASAATVFRTANRWLSTTTIM